MNEHALAAMAKVINGEAEAMRSDCVPLTKTDPETGREVNTLCWVIDGKVVVHSERWEVFQGIVTRARKSLEDGMAAVAEAIASGPRICHDAG